MDKAKHLHVYGLPPGPESNLGSSEYDCSSNYKLQHLVVNLK
jgi:hypothetical protein